MGSIHPSTWYTAAALSLQELTLLAPEGTLQLVLAGGGSDVFVVSPVRAAGDVRLAPVGLTGMLNAGGAVLACELTGAPATGSAPLTGAARSTCEEVRQCATSPWPPCCRRRRGLPGGGGGGGRV